MVKFQCQNCRHELERRAGLINMYFTGDEKIMPILGCRQCNKEYLEVNMDAWLSNSVNYFTFAMPAKGR